MKTETGAVVPTAPPHTVASLKTALERDRETLERQRAEAQQRLAQTEAALLKTIGALEALALLEEQA